MSKVYRKRDGPKTPSTPYVRQSDHNNRNQRDEFRHLYNSIKSGITDLTGMEMDTSLDNTLEYAPSPSPILGGTHLADKNEWKTISKKTTGKNSIKTNNDRNEGTTNGNTDNNGKRHNISHDSVNQQPHPGSHKGKNEHNNSNISVEPQRKRDKLEEVIKVTTLDVPHVIIESADVDDPMALANIDPWTTADELRALIVDYKQCKPLRSGGLLVEVVTLHGLNVLLNLNTFLW